MTKEEMISKFQCPGCVGGCAPAEECESFSMKDDGPSGARCSNHAAGTRIMPARSGLLCLGLPKGFCRVSGHKDKSEPHMRLHVAGSLNPSSFWDKLNVPVWAMEKDGFLFVRTYMPRVDVTTVDVVEGGTLAMVPGAIDVGEFYDEID